MVCCLKVLMPSQKILDTCMLQDCTVNSLIDKLERDRAKENMIEER